MTWKCNICGTKNDYTDFCMFCGCEVGTKDQRYDTQIDDIDGWE